MPEMHKFAREERLPSYFMNRLQDFLSAARTDLRVTLKDATHVEVIPVEPYGVAAIDLQGLWRFRETPVSRVHPGGAAGTYTVWAVGTKQKIVEVPKPFTDETDYSFDLRITSGANPAGAGVEVFEKIAEVDWDGGAIIGLRQTYNAVTPAMLETGVMDGSGDVTWTRVAGGGFVPNLKANSVGAAELADESVDTAALIPLAVTAAKVAVEAITEGKLAANSVTTAKILARAVTGAKIAVEAIQNEHLAEEVVNGPKITNAAVTSSKIAGEAIDAARIANLAVTAAKLAAESVTGAKIAALAVTEAKIAALAVTEEKLADGAATSRKVKLTSGVIRSTAELELTEAWQDLAGTTLKLTPAVKSRLLIVTAFQFQNTGIGGSCDGTISVDGVTDEVDSAGYGWGAQTAQSNLNGLSEIYSVELTAAEHTIKLRAKCHIGEGFNEHRALKGCSFLYFLHAV